MPDIVFDAAIRTLPFTKITESEMTTKDAIGPVGPIAETVKTPKVVAADPKAGLQDKSAAQTEQKESVNEDLQETTTEGTASKETTQEAVEKLQSYADRLNRNLEFSVDDTSGRTVVTVKDGITEEVIRQIPSEEALRLSDQVEGGAVSFFDSRA